MNWFFTVAPVWAPQDEAPAPAAPESSAADTPPPSAPPESAPPAETALTSDGASPDAGAEGAEQPKADGEEALPAEFKLSAPEGMESFQGDFDTFSSEASEWMQANPDATAADAFKWAAERQAALAASQSQEMAQAFTQQIDNWDREARADKEIGGDRFEANLAVAKQAVDAFGSDALKSILDESGLGSHPEMIRFAYKAGQALADAPVLKTQGGTAKRSLADALYGKSERK